VLREGEVIRKLSTPPQSPQHHARTLPSPTQVPNPNSPHPANPTQPTPTPTYPNPPPRPQHPPIPPYTPSHLPPTPTPHHPHPNPNPPPPHPQHPHAHTKTVIAVSGRSHPRLVPKDVSRQSLLPHGAPASDEFLSPPRPITTGGLRS